MCLSVVKLFIINNDYVRMAVQLVSWQVQHASVSILISVTYMYALNIACVHFFQIAMGIPLYNIKDIRTMYGHDPFGKDPIDLDK